MQHLAARGTSYFPEEEAENEILILRGRRRRAGGHHVFDCPRRRTHHPDRGRVIFDSNGNLHAKLEVIRAEVALHRDATGRLRQLGLKEEAS